MRIRGGAWVGGVSREGQEEVSKRFGEGLLGEIGIRNKDREE